MSEATNNHRIRVSASVRDNSGGTAYAFALNRNPSIEDITRKIKQTRLVPANMTLLGAFTSTATTLTAEVKEFVDWDTLTGATVGVPSGLVNYNDNTAAIVGLYYVFIYAVDPFKNSTIMPHPQNPIPMTTETVEVTQQTLGSFLAAGTANYAEQHNGVVDATVVLQKPFFDFYAGRTDKLYANVSVDPKDSVVNDVSVVAFSSAQTPGLSPDSSWPAFATQKKVIYSNSDFPIFGVEKTGLAEVSIDTFFTDTTDVSAGTSFTQYFTDSGYGAQLFYVYVTMRDIGFDKWIVKEYVVSVGDSPILTGSTAEIVVVV